MRCDRDQDDCADRVENQHFGRIDHAQHGRADETADQRAAPVQRDECTSDLFAKAEDMRLSHVEHDHRANRDFGADIQKDAQRAITKARPQQQIKALEDRAVVVMFALQPIAIGPNHRGDDCERGRKP